MSNKQDLKEREYQPDNKTLVIIPVYNEYENIKKVIEEIRQELPDVDILIIDDGSIDNSQYLLRNLKNVISLVHPFNIGYALALKTGFKYAIEHEYQYIIQFDGDGQHIASEAHKLLNTIRELQSDIVIGSRFMEKSGYRHSFLRRMGTRIFRSLIKSTCNKEIFDPTSGFQVLNRSVFTHYARMPYFPQFPDANLIVEMILSGFVVHEVPVKMRNRFNGKGMHDGIFSSMNYMVLIIYNIIIILTKHQFKRSGY
jgi:glycosyltransferase involved in cell wall biosynthesis